MRPSLWFKMGLREWPSYIPLAPALRTYSREDFNHDLVAGLIVGMVTIPQAVAYAFLAGVPPQAGLYACLVPMVLYAIFGSSNQLVVGPVAVAALMVAATVSQYAPRYSDEYLAITTIICLQSGIFLWLLRLSRMGGLVNLLSHPVITGFVNAAAILIIVSQLPALTGIQVADNSQPFTVLAALLEQIGTIEPWITVAHTETVAPPGLGHGFQYVAKSSDQPLRANDRRCLGYHVGHLERRGRTDGDGRSDSRWIAVHQPAAVRCGTMDSFTAFIGHHRAGVLCRKLLDRRNLGRPQTDSRKLSPGVDCHRCRQHWRRIHRRIPSRRKLFPLNLEGTAASGETEDFVVGSFKPLRVQG